LKCHMNDIAASIGLVQLKKLPKLNERRKQIVLRYFECLDGIPEIELPLQDDEVFRSAWHIFHIKCERRDDLSVYLSDKGIATGSTIPQSIPIAATATGRASRQQKSCSIEF